MRIFLYKALLVKLLITVSVSWLMPVNKAVAQQPAGINVINTYLDSLAKTFTPEKIYIQTDKSFYNSGDTLWFKGYLFDARFFTNSVKSGVVYVELISPENITVKRSIYSARDGLFRGSIVLHKDELKSGMIIMRAYTNWMQNWDSNYFFTKSVYFNNTDDQAANVTNATITATGENTASPKNQQSTGSKLSTELHFMPEGGHLVYGLTSTIGFKATNIMGKGINIAGTIFNNKDRPVAQFTSLYAGMGCFQLTPAAGENYYAIIDTDTDKKHYTLPKAEPTGIIMHVDGHDAGDILKVSLTANGMMQTNAKYYLVAQSRGALCYAANLKFNTNKVTAVLQKNKFQSGIVRLSLFDEQLRPVCERVVFVDHDDALHVNLKNASSPIPKTRDSVALLLKVTNKAGEPIQGSFSMAVTDDDLVNPDTSAGIRASLLITTDLNGPVEAPAYYFGDATNRLGALDALMLTQGWVNYKWNDMKVPAVKFEPQPEFSIEGRLTNLFNKGVPHTKIQLLSKTPFFSADTLTDENGYFSFNNIPPIDAGNFLLQALKDNNRMKSVSFKIIENEPAPLSKIKVSASWPNLTTADTSLLAVIKKNNSFKRKADDMLYGKNLLREVTITGKKIIKGSKNLNGPGNADQTIDEAELLKANKTPLITLLYQRISGFREGIFPMKRGSLSASGNKSENPAEPPPGYTNATEKSIFIPKRSYMVKSHRVRFVFDGIDAETFFQPAGELEDGMERFLYLKGVLEQFTAEDIKGLELMEKGNYNNIYNSKVASAYEKSVFISPLHDRDYAYIEITTRSGKGPFINIKDGFYVYRPLMPSWSKEFYKPRHNTQNNGSGVDFRSTLHWESNIVTNEKGEATVSFYTSDQPGRFTVIIEGSNMNGLFGTGKGSFNVK